MEDIFYITILIEAALAFYGYAKGRLKV